MKDNCEEFIVKLSKLEREQEEELKVSVQSSDRVDIMTCAAARTRRTSRRR